MINKQLPPLIFVWLGSNFPKWGIESINFAASINIDRKVILLLDKKSNITSKNNFGLFEIIYLSEEFINSCHFKEEVNLADLFWINTAKRLNILYRHCKLNNIEKFFHAEIDNIIFNLKGLENNLDLIGQGFFAPKDNAQRALASLIYCNRIQSIMEIIKYFYPPYSAKSEMHALGFYSKESKFFFALPTESFSEVNKWELISPNKTNGIFDAAAIGQYIFGIDPIHEPYKPLYNMYVNENVLIELKNLKFYIKDKNLIINFKKIKKQYKIYNLHIHSKKIGLAREMIQGNNNILKNLSIGKKTLIANKHKLFTGKLRYLIHIMKKKLENKISK